jgi:hypothetical protein
MARHRWILALFGLPVLLTACPGPSDEDGDGSLVVGVQTSLDLGPLVASVHVVAKVDGAVVRDETLPTSALPTEIELRGAAGAPAEIFAEGLAAGAAPGSPALVTRTAIAALVPDAKKLLRVNLEARCLLATAPSCAAPQTCVAGQCVPSEVHSSQLEEYEPAWASAPPDICRPAGHGSPEVILGTGQTDYANLADGQVLQLEKGPQGGHHIWIAARMKNLRQSQSITTITSTLEGDPAPVPPMAYVFTFDRDEGAYCKLHGLRYQVDSGAVDLGTTYRRFLGKRLTVTVEVADTTGAKASSTRTIQIADKLLCPDGTDTCNTPQ